VGHPESMGQAPVARSRPKPTTAERIAWTVGVSLVAYWGVWYVAGVTGQRDAMRQFALLRTARSGSGATPDQTLWSAERITAWQQAKESSAAAPLALLRIPRLHVEAPVLEGTDDVTLNRGVGHIADTAAPGTDGNSGIAGHRDGFFRGLKDIVPGDVIELESTARTETYRVERTWIVNPDEVSVLDPTPARSITLVTCYPFYFIGSAPQRFIVRAVRADDRAGLAQAAR
jgi:sortase A